ncbi:hypothetical protein [Bartonella senegalensis]|uniref:hypothetical protein n=1 Tax=Bartonella senegalensis TaxID=1468418 RepID=UPI0003158A86|nr:hypothetical protein [Bartonella senegalensis]
MVKVFKSQVFNIFIAVFFSLSQIISAHANHLSNSAQQEKLSVSEIEHGKNKEINITTLYAANFNHQAENETALEGKFEKVVEPITIGIFGIGIAIGYATTAAGLFLGWIINLIRYKK